MIESQSSSLTVKLADSGVDLGKWIVSEAFKFTDPLGLLEDRLIDRLISFDSHDRGLHHSGNSSLRLAKGSIGC